MSAGSMAGATGAIGTRIAAVGRMLRSAAATAVFEPALFLRGLGAVLHGRRRYRSRKMLSADWARPPAAVRTRLGAHLLESGERFDRPAWKGRVAEVLVAWNAEEMEHEAATAELRAIASGLDPTEAVPEAFFAMARATSSGGLFAASHEFVELGYRRILLDAAAPGAALRDRLRGVLVDIHRRRIDRALEAWAPLRDAHPAPATTSELHALVDRYLSAIQGVPPRSRRRDPLDAVSPEGEPAGTVIAVQNYGAGDLLEIAPPRGPTFLVPFSDAHVPTVDIAARRVTIVPPVFDTDGRDAGEGDT